MIRWISVDDDLPPTGELVLVYKKFAGLWLIGEDEFDPRIGWEGVGYVHYWAAYPNVPLISNEAPVEHTQKEKEPDPSD